MGYHDGRGRGSAAGDLLELVEHCLDGRAVTEMESLLPPVRPSDRLAVLVPLSRTGAVAASIPNPNPRREFPAKPFASGRSARAAAIAGRRNVGSAMVARTIRAMRGTVRALPSSSLAASSDWP